MNTVRYAALVAACAAGALLLSGCSSDTGGKRAREAAEEAAENAMGQADTPRMKVAMITHGAPGDTFWDTVREGAEAAAHKSNAELVYSSDPEVSGQAGLIQNAIDQDVDGIAVTLAHPEGLADAIRRAEDAGIPVVGLNSGMDAWREMDLLSYFGQDERLTGEAFGERLNETGAEHAVCVIHEQGHVDQEARCDGVAATFEGESEILYVDGADMPSVRSTIEAKLRQDSSVDYVVALGAPFALAAVGSVDDAASDARIATFDLNPELVTAIEDGDMEFAVDQQPYLQGYLAVDALWLFHNNGNFSGGGVEPVLTGPAFVDRENIEEIAGFARNGTR
ncbi:sugar ABC transporter substrate-binding protein [Streptomyces sp. NBC_01803]|uniref:sugar ABC transporter substrate-binding protein n=1 Tax=Streptomyces sp. NBC_01803 TaxID=2975946 RepID=UPI002DDA1599|nr:sugar ABC transporter substrate-binding protein [Streptomyces sp. NBC_01803]WSA46110.1 sugar ABC transporter substrate-binding protein [Streptomyces sp. NBC_01803]